MGCVVVTGAAGGIGQALVRGFVQAGSDVIAVDRVERPADLATDQYISCDLARTVRDPAHAGEIFAKVRAALGARPLDALINNAAIQILGSIESLDRDAWRDSLEVNLLAPFIWTQALLPELEASRGSVLNISSIHARLTKPGFVAYATSKAALSGMTRAMAVELGSRVRVNAIEPAAIDTPMLRAGFSGNAEGFSALESHHPVGQVGSAEGLASLAVAIVREGSGFLSGSLVGLDGAIAARLHDPV
ncbi:SDR family NAD(P)-dependent oxidoreductase [Marilutibacter aestuarii]|uniref:SDR family NAD(P)-dependent oxidoreductase n=1 Tax=Marilutibacter aestuarii TaxID=1706195 RepID=UPI0014772A83|nr:SDR family oxidoreductase [Lysobacter aestuarii]